jgi:hypothetical protein
VTHDIAAGHLGLGVPARAVKIGTQST